MCLAPGGHVQHGCAKSCFHKYDIISEALKCLKTQQARGRGSWSMGKKTKPKKSWRGRHVAAEKCVRQKIQTGRTRRGTTSEYLRGPSASSAAMRASFCAARWPGPAHTHTRWKPGEIAELTWMTAWRHQQKRFSSLTKQEEAHFHFRSLVWKESRLVTAGYRHMRWWTSISESKSQWVRAEWSSTLDTWVFIASLCISNVLDFMHRVLNSVQLTTTLLWSNLIF